MEVLENHRIYTSPILGLLYYDQEGNLTTFSNITNTWSYNNRLTKQVRGTNYYSKITINYLYDYAGERAYQNISSYYDGQKVTYYPNDYYNTYTDSLEYLNTKTTKQIFGNGETVATIEITKEYDEDDNIIDVYTTYFNHNDILGSISAISDISGNLVTAQDYYPYGSQRVSAGGSYNSQRKYIGEIYDSITDLNYLNARYYSSNKGQFISQDPVFWEVGDKDFEKKYERKLEQYLMNPQALNSYSYGNNNPINLSDPSGEIVPLIVIAAGIWAAAELGLTAYDGYNIYKTYNDPNSTEFEKGIAVSGFAAGIIGPGGGYGTMGGSAVKFISKNADSLIQIGKKELQHAINGHAWNSLVLNKSKFLKGVDPVKLINEASNIGGTVQKRTGNVVRIIKNGTEIGVDRATNQLTDTYTVVTKLLKDGKEKLITVFPGIPKP